MKNSGLINIFFLFLLFTVIAGCIEGSFARTETVLVKLDSQENIQWISVIQNPDYATARASAPLTTAQYLRFIETSDRGFFIAARYSNRTGHSALRVIKTDSNGNPLWDQRLPDHNDRIFTLGQFSDGEYAVTGYDGKLETFDTWGNKTGAVNILDPICQTNGTVCYDLTPISLTQNPDETLDWVLTNGNFSTSQTSLISATVDRNGMLLKKEGFPPAISNGATDFIRTGDNGWLSGKEYRDETPGGEYRIQIEKTNASYGISWDTVLKSCTTTTSCNNDLIGMHESGDGYDIIYQSHPRQSNESVPVDTIFARLDMQGHIVRQDNISNLSGLPAWIFGNCSSRAEFYDLIPEAVLDSAANAQGGNNPTFRYTSPIRTTDGGFAVLGTRYYWI
ncbi:MAG: hypothetical protein LUQ31_06025 [Methanoregula sp.]|nr:hypothetical protein [Methanoregula sp.]